MGARGPAPKRSEVRLRQNEYPETSKGASGLFTEAPFQPDEKWHPTAKVMWEAAQRSGQTQYYEPTDWIQVYIMCEAVSRELRPQFIGFSEKTGVDKDGNPFMEKKPVQATIPIKGATLSSLRAWMASLMFTEVDRRRANVELQQPESDPDEERGLAAVLELKAVMKDTTA